MSTPLHLAHLMSKLYCVASSFLLHYLDLDTRGLRVHCPLSCALWLVSITHQGQGPITIGDPISDPCGARKGDGNKKGDAFHFCGQNREKQLETEIIRKCSFFGF
jgi:hypothetical protein